MLFGSGGGCLPSTTLPLSPLETLVIKLTSTFLQNLCLPAPQPPSRISRTSTPIVPKGQWPTPELASSRPHHGASSCALHLGTSILFPPPPPPRRSVGCHARRAQTPQAPAKPSLSTHCLHSCPPRTESRPGLRSPTARRGRALPRRRARANHARAHVGGPAGAPHPRAAPERWGQGGQLGGGGGGAVGAWLREDNNKQIRSSLRWGSRPSPRALRPWSRAEGAARDQRGRLGYRPGRWAAARRC